MPYIPIRQADAQQLLPTGNAVPATATGETFSTLVADLNKIVGVRPDVDEDRFKKWVNDAYRDLSSSTLIAELDIFKFSLAFDLVVGQPLYTLPNEVRAILDPGLVVISDDYPSGGNPLTKIDLAAYRNLPDDEGVPTRFFRLHRILVVWPTPDEVLSMTLDYLLRPDPMENEADSPIYPPEWHEGIKLSARVKALTDLLEFDRAAAADNDLTAWMRRRTSADELEDQNKAVGMQPVANKRSVSSYTIDNLAG